MTKSNFYLCEIVLTTQTVHLFIALFLSLSLFLIQRSKYDFHYIVRYAFHDKRFVRYSELRILVSVQIYTIIITESRRAEIPMFLIMIDLETKYKLLLIF